MTGGNPARRRGLLALLAALIVVAALAVAWRAWRPARSPAAGDPGALVVMPVELPEPAGDDAWLRQGLAEMIGAQLGQTPGLHVVARHRLAGALAASGFEDARTPPEPAARQIAARLRAEHLILASFARTEDHFTLSARVVAVATGRMTGTTSVRKARTSDLLDAVNEVCLDLLHDLEPPSAGSGGWRGARLPTRSIEAYRRYTEALTLFARGGRKGAEAAEAQLDQAVAIDPAFAQAYVKKAEIQRWRREWGYGDADPTPAILAAARLVGELPDRERLLVESFESLIVRQQPAAALRDWNALLQFYPSYAEEVGIPGLVAETLQKEGRWDDLIVVGEAHIVSPSLPDPDRARLSELLAQALRHKGEFERALQNARRAVRLWPSREGPRFLSVRNALGRISLDAGRKEEALAEFRAVRRAPEADAPDLTQAAWGLYMAGEATEAADAVDAALKHDDGYGNAYHLRGWLLLARKEYRWASASLENAFDGTPRTFGSPSEGFVSGDLAALYYAAVAAHKQGERARAEALFTRLVEHCRKIQERAGPEGGSALAFQAANFIARAAARRGREAKEPARLQGDDTTYLVQSARLHAVQGRRDQALGELERGMALGHGERQHIKDDPDFESLHGDPRFEQLVGR